MPLPVVKCYHQSMSQAPRHIRHRAIGSILELAWEAPLDEDYRESYEIRVGSEPWIDLRSAATSHRVRGLAPLQSYQIAVRARSATQSGPEVTLDVSMPPRPKPELTGVGVRLPLLSVNRQQIVVRIESIDCQLTIWWQPRDSAWYATLEIPTGNRVVSSRRIATDAPILAGTPSRLRGDIYCRSLSSAKPEPGLEAWGTTHALFHELPR